MLVEIINRIAEETQEERQPYKHRPSSACRCIRSLVYHATGVEAKPLPGRALLVFDDGRWAEELTANWIRKSTYNLHSEQMYVDIFEINGVKVGGSIDGIIQDLTGKDYLWEHKAINHFSFNRIQDEVSSGHDYYVQCALYLWGLQKIQPDITEAVLCIKNKNTAQYFELFIVANWPAVEIYNVIGTQKGLCVYKIENVIQKCKGTFETVDSHVALKTLPARPYARDAWNCSYCGWQELCWVGYRAEVEAMPENIDLSKILYIDQASLFREYINLLSVKSNTDKRLKELKEMVKTILNENKVQTGYYGTIWFSRIFRDVKGYTVPSRIDEILNVKQL